MRQILLASGPTPAEASKEGRSKGPDDKRVHDYAEHEEEASTDKKPDVIPHGDPLDERDLDWIGRIIPAGVGVIDLILGEIGLPIVGIAKIRRIAICRIVVLIAWSMQGKRNRWDIVRVTNRTIVIDLL